LIRPISWALKKQRGSPLILIALGANLPSQFGSPRETIKRAITEIAKMGVRVLYQSPIYLTAPVPVSDQPWYHNAVIGVSTDYPPAHLLKILQTIENNFGRIRTERNAPRMIDLDIIAYNDVIQNYDDLILPHARMHERAFVLYPLRDIARNWVHPVSGTHIDDLINAIPAGQDIKREACPRIMGIVNVTPDSFSDGGQFESTDAAIQHGLQCIVEGADILDIGGESTRPASVIISPDEEQRRILPVIEGLKNAGALISVDTRNASTMRAAVQAGAGMVNDISALTHDVDSMDVVRGSDCRICLMHMQGTPQTMQTKPQYDDVVTEVYDYLAGRISACEAQGISKDRLMIDVGIGFGKTVGHNIALFQSLSLFHELGVDVLLGASRKRFIEAICGESIPADQRLAGSLAAVARGCQSHAQVVRVHDVFETRQFIDVYCAVSV